jgi:hypothetical protein
MAGTRDRISIYQIPGRRLAEPHDYGIKKGVDKLLAFQIGGASRSRAPHGWRDLNIEEIQDFKDFKVLERHFPGSRADAHLHHGVWDVLFARVK